MGQYEGKASRSSGGWLQTPASTNERAVHGLDQLKWEHQLRRIYRGGLPDLPKAPLPVTSQPYIPLSPESATWIQEESSGPYAVPRDEIKYLIEKMTLGRQAVNGLKQAK